MQVAAKITGVDEFVRKARRIGDVRTQRRILKAAMRSGLNPVKTEMRRQIRAVGARRRGHLLKAVTSKLKVYASGVAWLAAGIRDRRLPDGANPGKYFHLVDLGTKPHTIYRREPIRVNLNGRWMTLQGPYQHFGARPKPIRHPALQRAGQRVAPTMAKRFGTLMEREASKRT